MAGPPMDRQLQAVIDHMPGLVSYWDAALINVFANRQYGDFFGLTPEQVQGRHIRQVLGDEVFAKNFPYMERVLQGEKVMFERILIDASGKERLTVASYLPEIQEGRVCGFYAFVTDHTQLKHAQQVSLEAQKDLKHVLDAATDFAIISTDLGGTIRLFSEGAEVLLGYRADEVVGRQTPVLFYDLDELRARELELTAELGRSVRGFEVFVQQALKGQSERRRWTLSTRSGARVAVSVVVTAITGTDDRPSGFLFVARDVSSEMESRRRIIEAVEAAEAANQAKSLFLANMSHEIRTPMNGVLGIAQLLKETNLDDQQQEYVGMIQSAGQSLLQIINDILDFSKIEAGKLEISSAEFSPAEMLRTVTGILSLKAAERGLPLEVTWDKALPERALGDSLRLQQVLLNLIGNALKFTPSGSVSLVVSPVDEQWEFRVTDTGVGISAEQMARLFQPFEQAEKSTTRKFGGTGLGLSISKRLVGLMGGTIGATSELGVGSQFWFRIGLKDLGTTEGNPAASRSGAAPSREWRLDGMRVLLVDDAPLNLVVAKSLLSKVGALVETTVDGSQCVERLRRGPTDFDVVLMDVQMPVMDGFDATVVIRNDLELTLPVIALTAGVMADEREKCLAVGMNGIVAKPIERTELLRTLQHLVPGPWRLTV